MTIQCLNCGNEFEGVLSFDNLGWYSSCPECNGNFYVDLCCDYVVNLWQYDFAPYSSIDDLPEHHTFVKQFVFNKTCSLDKCNILLSQLNEHEGLTYELFDSNGQRCALGVFSRDSLEDDIWYTQ